MIRLKLPRVRRGLRRKAGLRTRGKDRDQEERGTDIQKEGNRDLKTERARDQRERWEEFQETEIQCRTGTETQRKGCQEPRKSTAPPRPAPTPGYCFPLGRCVGGEWGCLELCTWSPMSLPPISPRLVLHALADLVQGPGRLRNPHHGPCPPGLCGGPEGVPLPPGPGEFPSTLPPLGSFTSCP